METRLLAPTSMEELFGALKEMTPESKIIGGGTDLTIKMDTGICAPDALLYMGGIDELRRITEEGGILEIGAAATMSELCGNAVIKEKLTALYDAAQDVGSPQIRNSATIGGNIGNASPAGDIPPALLLYNASAVIASESGVYEKPMKDVIIGPSKTCLAYNEALVKIKVEIPQDPRYRSAFVKLGFRKAVTISRIGLAASGNIADGKIYEPSIIAGAISIKPLHVKKAEEYLDGIVCDDDAKKTVGRFLSELILEVTPKEFDRDYKIGAAYGIAEDVLNRLVSREVRWLK